MSRSRKIALGSLFAFAILLIVQLIPGPPERTAVVVSDDGCYFGWGADQAQQAMGPGGLECGIRTDADGFRTGSGTAPGPACEILAVGDSFTEGLCVRGEEAWPAVLERELGPRVRVHNGGMRGHTIVHERAAVLARWRELEPSVVIVAHLPNDLADLALAAERCPIPPAVSTRFRPDVPPWILRTHAGRWLAELGLYVRREQQQPGVTPLPAAQCGPLARRYEDEVRALIDGVAGWGGRVVFVMLGPFVCAGGREDFTRLHRRIRDALAVAGGVFVDASSVFDRPEHDLRPRDTHPSPLGHRAIAAEIRDAMLRAGLLDECPQRN